MPQFATAKIILLGIVNVNPSPLAKGEGSIIFQVYDYVFKKIIALEFSRAIF